MKSQIIAHMSEGRIQTVDEHCRQTALYASREAESCGLSSVMYVAGVLHDIGKCSDEFQQYIRQAHVNPDHAKRGSVNHSSAGGAFLLKHSSSDQQERLAYELIACAVFQHHGLMDCIKDGHDLLDIRMDIEQSVYDTDIRQAKSLLDQLDNYLPLAIEEVKAKAKTLKEIAEKMSHDRRNVSKNGFYLLSCLERLILSYLTDADWRDTGEFMNAVKESRVSQSDRELFFKDSLQKIEDYAGRFTADTRINQLRQEMADACLHANIANKGVYKLAMPTGGGKTITSMRLALRLAKKYHKKHIIYIAPFLSILEQNAQVIRSIIQDDDYILEHHSNVEVSEDDEVYRSLCETWDSPVILTTMVQFLNTMFQGKMSSVRRFHQLTDAIIIVDEAQNIPVKCIHMFNAMMNFLCYSGSSIGILCTATQPLFESVKRSLIYHEHKDILPDADKYQDAFKRTRIISKVKNKPMDTDELADFIQNVFDRNLLIVLNTKSSVKTLYGALKNKIDPSVKLVQLTTYMCAEHRLDVIHELKEILKNQRVICISTQLIEAGVDISFQTVIRSLSGVDSLNQAAGRCNRNGETSLGNVYVIDYEEENTSRLPDIQEARKAARFLIDRKIEDLSAEKAVQSFYHQYYFQRCNEMDYSVAHHKIFDLLSCNTAQVQDVRSTQGARHILCQSFKSAGKEFSVIDHQDMAVLAVPYKEASDYLNGIEDTNDYAVIRSFLKKLQRYMISLPADDQMLKRLLKCHAVSFIDKAGIYRLDADFYNDKGIAAATTSSCADHA